MERKNKTVVISVDSLITEDIPVLKELPNLSELMKQSSFVKNIHCVYPTLTYPCHVTIATGVYPDRHGIYNNEILDINAKKADWYWWRSAVKVDTIIDAAKKSGFTTSTVTWPVMGNSGADYNIGEIWAPTAEEDPAPYFERADSPEVKHIFEKNKKKLDWLKTPAFDHFAAACAVDIIHEFKPDLMLVHFSYVDHQRHKLGVDHPQITGPLGFADEKIGEIIKAWKEEGFDGRVNYVILGDHGQINCSKMFHINRELAERGYIDVDQEGKVTGYRIYAHSCAYSTQVYLGPQMDAETAHKVLSDIKREYPDCIETIYTLDQVNKQFHTDGPFSFMLEGVEGVTFGKTVNAEKTVETQLDCSDYRWSVSTHGHDPKKGRKPPFILSGPDVIPGVEIDGGFLVDEAPTIMEMMGITLENVDGTSFSSLLRESYREPLREE